MVDFNYFKNSNLTPLRALNVNYVLQFDTENHACIEIKFLSFLIRNNGFLSFINLHSNLNTSSFSIYMSDFVKNLDFQLGAT
jgi:hypothetical protein